MEFLKTRHQLQAQGDAAVIAKSLTCQRDQLREFIVSYSMGKAKTDRRPGGTDSIFGWITDLVIAESKSHSQAFGAASFHAGIELSYAICQHGGPNSPPHIAITLPSPWRASLRLNNDQEYCCSLFDGDIQAWVASRMQHSVAVSCPAESTPGSDLPAVRYQPWVEVPIVLSIDYEEPFSAMKWTLPLVLYPLGEDVGRDEELVYDLVGVAVATGSNSCAHFVAYFTLPDGTLFCYDGMEHGGNPTRFDRPLDEHTLRHFTSNSYIAGAVYHLRGGSVAQTAFFHHQAEMLEADHGIILTRLPNLSGHDIALHPQRWDVLACTDRLLSGVPPSVGPAIEAPTGPDSAAPSLALVPSRKRPRATSTSREPPRPKRHRTDTSPAALLCRCQATTFDANMGPTIRCSICDQHSHLSCLPGGYVPLLIEPSKFKCHNCESMTSERRMQQLTRDLLACMKTWEHKPLHERLHPGMAALACYLVDGEPCRYWYPVRLIGLFNQSNKEYWRVAWWPHSSFIPDGHQPENLVPVEFVVDALMGDQQGRRSIRLGKWMVASDPDALDPLSNFRAHRYTPDVDDLLQPHKEVLKALALPHAAKQLLTYTPSLRQVPVLAYEVETRQMPKWINWGNLAPLTAAHICYWVSMHVDANVQIARGRVLYHAANIALASHNSLSLVDAWTFYQVELQGLRPLSDIDTFALYILEQRMFDQSVALGPAALSQWGLDAGEHQQRWNPYADGPTHDEHTAAGWDCDSEEYDTLLTRGANFERSTSPIGPASDAITQEQHKIAKARERALYERAMQSPTQEGSEEDEEGEPTQAAQPRRSRRLKSNILK
ncbi:hypothetical protein EXIGLDRAFT_263749 [Exidia glandulosa HHB12029]|uniref:Zinc finger PHD-type domain-containing protein n=1 Tax=Exidia glandulosa HHB12029 TaxID=1314781 RepID=A0A165DQY6_EXIGL|nr:hypothetical protein EXIGLDRAFT_263749 [Exidia glandulosa HHB12029]